MVSSKQRRIAAASRAAGKQKEAAKKEAADKGSSSGSGTEADKKKVKKAPKYLEEEKQTVEATAPPVEAKPRWTGKTPMTQLVRVIGIARL